jgi:hypothetical protein
MKRKLMMVLLAVALSGAVDRAANAHDKLSDVSAVSALPVASVIVSGYAASVAAAAAVAVPVALSAHGAVLVVKSVEASARGAVCVLERASDGARVTLELVSRAGRRTSVAVGDAMVVSVAAAGAAISLAGEVIAFVPNELGRALLYNERVTF